MSAFLAKLVLVLVAVYLLVGVLPAASALLPHAEDGQKSFWQVDGRDGLKKISGRKEGNFGSQNAILSKTCTIVPTRSLRVMINSRAPPPPIRNKATSQFISAAPPPAIAY